MKGFYWAGWSVRCGFCGQSGHNITTCKAVNRVASQAMQDFGSIPNYIMSQDEHIALQEIKRRFERLKPKPKKKRKPPRCSYCKSLKHKRPNCNDLKRFRQLVYKANKNWKRIFTQRVNDRGLGIGALIQLEGDYIKNLNYKLTSNGIAMITGYNISDLSVFCGLNVYSEYQSNSTFQIMSGDWIENLSIKFLSVILDYDLLSNSWWDSRVSPRVLSPMKWEPSKEWLDSEWDEVFAWFFKDINQHDLNSEGISSFIEKWAKKV